MPVTSVIDHPLQFDVPSSFSAKERIVPKHETLSVPQIFLPEKVTARLDKSKFSVTMFYVLDENTQTTDTEKGIKIAKGSNSGRIFSIEAPLAKTDFHSFLNRMGDIRKALHTEIQAARSLVEQRNYELILSLVNKSVNIASTQREQIEKILKTVDEAQEKAPEALSP